MEPQITPLQYTSEIINILSRITQGVGRLEGVNLVTPGPRLRHENRIRTIQASLAIEGNSLTRSQVTAVLEGKRVIGPPKDILETRNAATVYSRFSQWDPLSMDALLAAHGVLMENLMDDPGSFRRGPVGVIRKNKLFHAAPPWQQVAPMMKTLFDYLGKSNDHPIIAACRFHFQLEHIHPFMDGNGRIGRLWQTRLLMRFHPLFEYLPIEHLIHEHRQNYYDALAHGDDTADCTRFVLFILTQMEQILYQTNKGLRGVTLTMENRLEIARRTMGADEFSRKDYQTLIKTISTATASRDLGEGVRLGILIRFGDKRTAVYRFAPT